jgi:hypothetical protein
MAQRDTCGRKTGQSRITVVEVVNMSDAFKIINPAMLD